jgi:hypothetical protein
MRMNVAAGVKTIPYGRFVFGVSAIAFGVLLTMWHDADTWQGLPLVKLPAFVADIFTVLLVVGGFGILIFPRTLRTDALILGFVTVVFTLGCIPAIVQYPTQFFTYGNFFEFFSLVCGAIALYAMSEPDPARSALSVRVARIMLGICVLSFAVAQIAYPKVTADLVPAWFPPGQMFWVIVTTIAFGLAAIAMLIDRQARLAMDLTGLMLVLFGLLVWVPILIAQPGKHFNWSEIILNYFIAGAVLLVAEAMPSGSRATAS